MRKRHIFLLSIILLLGILAGCNSSNDNNDNSNKQEEPKTEQEQQTNEASFPVTLEDGNGEEITIEEKPERIVSVLPSNTEIAFALGLGDKIVGVSDYDNYPEEALEKEKIGGLEMNIEKIISLEPQLVLANPTIDANGLDQLGSSGIQVLIVNDATDFAGVYQSIDMIGKATGTEQKAAEIIEGMKENLLALEEKSKTIEDNDRKKAFVEISPEPEIYTAGKNTFMDDILSIIQAENVASDQDGWVMMNEEAVIEKNPDVIITTYGDFVENSKEQVLRREGWQDVAAIKNEQVIDVNTDLVSRPGPRLVEGAEILGKTIYPDIFAE